VCTPGFKNRALPVCRSGNQYDLFVARKNQYAAQLKKRGTIRSGRHSSHRVSCFSFVVPHFVILLADEIASRQWLAAYFNLSHHHRRVRMGNEKSMEKAVESLPRVDLAEFRRGFTQYDAASGKFGGLVAGALADYRAGTGREL
jgi:hypothetical protein